jgi:alkylation response protein AidB-like acyl-CoA dehydrogenase
MSLGLTAQELSFQRRVKVFAEKHLRPLADKIEAEEYFPRDFLRALGRNGFLGAPFSRSDGGLSLGWVCETIEIHHPKRGLQGNGPTFLMLPLAFA